MGEVGERDPPDPGVELPPLFPDRRPEPEKARKGLSWEDMAKLLSNFVPGLLSLENAVDPAPEEEEEGLPDMARAG